MDGHVNGRLFKIEWIYVNDLKNEEHVMANMKTKTTNENKNNKDETTWIKQQLSFIIQQLLTFKSTNISNI